MQYWEETELEKRCGEIASLHGKEFVSVGEASRSLATTKRIKIQLFSIVAAVSMKADVKLQGKLERVAENSARLSYKVTFVIPAIRFSLHVAICFPIAFIVIHLIG